MTFPVLDIKITIADITTGENNISKAMIADQESLRPKEFVKSIGTNMINTIPKIMEITATGFEKG